MPVALADNVELLATSIGAEHIGPNIAVTGRKNILAVCDVQTRGYSKRADGPEKHRLFHIVVYTTTNLTTGGATEINSLPIGSECLELRVSGGAVVSAAKWLKTGASTWAAV